MADTPSSGPTPEESARRAAEAMERALDRAANAAARTFANAGADAADTVAESFDKAGEKIGKAAEKAADKVKEAFEKAAEAGKKKEEEKKEGWDPVKDLFEKVQERFKKMLEAYEERLKKAAEPKEGQDDARKGGGEAGRKDHGREGGEGKSEGAESGTAHPQDDEARGGRGRHGGRRSRQERARVRAQPHVAAPAAHEPHAAGTHGEGDGASAITSLRSKLSAAWKEAREGATGAGRVMSEALSAGGKELQRAALGIKAVREAATGVAIRAVAVQEAAKDAAGRVSKLAGDAVGSLRGMYDGAMDRISAAGGRAADSVGGYFTRAHRRVVESAPARALSNAYDATAKAAGNAGRAMGDAFTTLGKGAANAGRTAAGFITGPLKTAAGGLDKFFSPAIDAVRHKLGGMGEPLKHLRGAASTAGTAIRDALSSAAGSVRGVFSSMAGSLGGAFSSAAGRLRGTLGTTLGTLGTAEFTAFFNTVKAVIGRALQEADRLSGSLKTLKKTADGSGQSMGFMGRLADGARSKFHLSRAAANELTSAVVGLAGKTGDVTKSAQAMEGLVNLGAKRGMSTAETLKALQDATNGVEEGTKKLFDKSPDKLFEEYARSVGKATDELTDQDKAQAVYNETLRQGAEAHGKFAERARTAAGAQEEFEEKTSETAAVLGQALQPARDAWDHAVAAMYGAFTWLMEKTRQFVIGIQGLGIDAAEQWMLLPIRFKEFLASTLEGLAGWADSLTSLLDRLGIRVADGLGERLRGYARNLTQGLAQERQNIDAATREEYARLGISAGEGGTEGNGAPRRVPHGPVHTASTGGGRSRDRRGTTTRQPEERPLPVVDVHTELAASITLPALKIPAPRALPQEAALKGLRKTAMSVFAAIDAGAKAAAGVISASFADAFQRLFSDVGNLGAAFKALWQGMAKGAVDAIATKAKSRSGEEFAEAISALSYGLQFASTPGMQGYAAGQFAAAKSHAISGVEWAALAGGAAAAGSKLGGGGGGAAAAGGAPRSSRDAGSGVAQNATKSGPQIHIYVDGMDPRNPRHQQLTQQTLQGVQERYGQTGAVTYHTAGAR